MIRKEYHVGSTLSKKEEEKVMNSKIKDEIIRVIDTAFQNGAIVELKILEGVDLVNGGKRFSKIRMDVVSNTDFDKYDS